MMKDPSRHLWIWAALALGGTACSSGSSGNSGVANNPDGTVSGVVGQASTGSITPFTPRAQSSTTVVFTGPDAVVSVWKSQLTFFAGTVATDATLAMQLIPEGVAQTPKFQIVSPLLSFQATTAAGPLARETLRKTMRLQTIVDRFFDARHTVVIMILNYGTADERRYAVQPSDLTVTVQADNSRLVTFETRDTNFTFAVAVTSDGNPPAGFATYPAVPKDVSALASSAAGLADETSAVKLTWIPPNTLPDGYQLQLATAPLTTQGCAGGAAVPAAQVTTVTATFPVAASSATMTLTGLAPNQTVYLQLCAANARTPPDVSPGAALTYILPTRARAVLTGTPANPSNQAALNVAVGGDGVVAYQYALLPAAQPCEGASSSAWTPVASPIAGPVASGGHVLCVWAKKNDHNLQVVPTTYSWTTNLTPPAPFAISAVAPATNNTTPTFTWQAAAGVSAYRVRIASDSGCATGVQDANAFTESYAAAALADGPYYLCVTALDSAGNATAASNNGQAFVVDTVLPVFSSLALANGAADGYLNAAERASASPLVGSLAASDYGGDPVTPTYKLVAAATACDGALTYGSVPGGNSPDFAADGAYKVCVKLTDAAGNAAYGASPAFTKKVSLPGFTSVPLANDALDAYINQAESLLANPLVAAATGVNYDTAGYQLVPAATACNNALTYSAAIPADNSPGFGADGLYKVCVRLADNAGNPSVYGQSAPITLKNTVPAFGALALTNDASDGYVNAAERADGTALGGTLTASGYNAAAYKLVTAATLCNNALIYGAMPAANSTDFGADGSYKICVRLTDNAGNPPAFGASSVFVLDTTPPSALSISAPTAGATVKQSVYTVAWTNPGNADAYDVFVDSASGCPAPAQSYTGVTATSQTTTALADGVWYVCVKARDNAGNVTAASNTNLTFTVATGTWSATTLVGAPAGRRGATGVLNAAGAVVVWGGYDGTSYLSTGATYAAGDVWTATNATDAALPSGRWQHTATWTGTGMVVWGGNAGAGAQRGDGAVYTPGGVPAWTGVSAVGAPSARSNHSAVWSGSTVVVWGGFDGTGAVASGAEYDPAGDVWAATDLSDPDLPAARQNHTAVWTGTAMIVWGGSAGGTALASGAIYTPGGPDFWKPVSAASAPTAREGHTAIWTGTKMVVFGGHSGATYDADGGIYDPALDSWTALAVAGAPASRANHLVAWDGAHAQMIVWGGDAGGVYRGDGAVLDPAANAWIVPATNATSAPSARTTFPGVWTGSAVVLFGGYDGTSYLQSGSRYTPP